MKPNTQKRHPARPGGEKSVFVLDSDGRVMQPCHPARARKILDRKKGIVLSKNPFVIKLKSKKGTKMAQYIYYEGQTAVNLDQVCHIEQKEDRVMFFMTSMTARTNWHLDTEEKAKEVFQSIIKLLNARI